MLKYWQILSAGFGLLAAGLACSALNAASTETSVGTTTPECQDYAADFHVVADTDGPSFTMGVGQTVAVTLGSNASTGYQWIVRRSDAKLLRFDGKSYTGWNPMPGSGGAEAFCFTALAKGNTKLELAYLRTFEPTDIPPVKNFLVTITIQ